MKTGIFFRALCLYGFLFFGYVFADQMSVVQVEGSDLRQQFSVFKRCWYTIYKDCSLKLLGFSSMSKQLLESFEQDEQDYAKQAPNRLFFNAIQDGQIVGYISFDIREGQAVYIKHIALLPEFCTADSLRELVFIIFDYINDVSCVHMTLHDQAVFYKKLAAELGFVALPRNETGLYVPLRLQFNKCGTCLCDFDYEDGSDGMDDNQDDDSADDESWDCFDGSEADKQGCSKGDSSGFCSYFEEE